MIKTLVLFIITLKKTLTQSQLSFYVDRSINPHTLKSTDYLHLFLDDKKNEEFDFKNKKLIFELPVDLKNKEVFKIKICKKGTVSKLKLKNEDEEVIDLNFEIDEILDENCLFDEFNTLSIIDYKKKLFLEQNPIFNLYKICDFGFSFQEAEKSFILAKGNEIKNSLEMKNHEDLYYTNLDKIIELVKEAEKEDFRKLADSEKKSRCNIEFKQENLKNFESSNFLQETYFHIGDNSKSDFIIEYNFEDDFVIEKIELEDFKTEDMDSEKLIKTRNSIIKKMEQDYVIQKKNFPRAKINLKILNSEIEGNEKIEKFEIKIHKKEKDLSDEEDEIIDEENSIKINIEINENLKIETLFNIKFPINSYIRFFPMICLNNLDKNSEYSYEFISDKHCAPISKTKILLVKNENKKIHFYHKNNQQIFKSNKIEGDYDEFDLEFYPKDSPMDKIHINGFQDKCDGIYDKKLSLFYLICYQKLSQRKKRILKQNENRRIKKNERILSSSQDFETNSLFFLLKENSIKKNKKDETKSKDKKIPLLMGLTINSLGMALLGVIIALVISTYIGWIIMIVFIFIAFLSTMLLFIKKGKNFQNRMGDKEIVNMKKEILLRSFFTDFSFKQKFNLKNGIDIKYDGIEKKIDEDVEIDNGVKFIEIDWKNREGYLRMDIDKLFENRNKDGDVKGNKNFVDGYSDPDNTDLKKSLLVNV